MLSQSAIAEVRVGFVNLAGSSADAAIAQVFQIATNDPQMAPPDAAIHQSLSKKPTLAFSAIDLSDAKRLTLKGEHRPALLALEKERRKTAHISLEQYREVVAEIHKLIAINMFFETFHEGKPPTPSVKKHFEIRNELLPQSLPLPADEYFPELVDLSKSQCKDRCGYISKEIFKGIWANHLTTEAPLPMPPKLLADLAMQSLLNGKSDLTKRVTFAKLAKELKIDWFIVFNLVNGKLMVSSYDASIGIFSPLTKFDAFTPEKAVRQLLFDIHPSTSQYPDSVFWTKPKKIAGLVAISAVATVVAVWLSTRSKTLEAACCSF